jgi:uncharacterized pyridoxal phosphate-containing UPF0001 family protein
VASGVTAPTLAPAPPVEVVAERLAALRRRIEAGGGDPAAVTVVAVTKGFDAGAVRAALAVGLDAVGENYAAELLDKAAALGAGGGGAPSWHFLGALQRNKIGALAPVVSCWQSLARAVEGEAIARRAPGAPVFVEVTMAGLPGRPGVPAAGAPALVGELRGLGLDVRGLMTVGPPGPPEAAREWFGELAALAADLGLAELSMGMSDDVEVAVSQGATMVRVGRALFGPRPARAS